MLAESGTAIVWIALWPELVVLISMIEPVVLLAEAAAENTAKSPWLKFPPIAVPLVNSRQAPKSVAEVFVTIPRAAEIQRLKPPREAVAGAVRESGAGRPGTDVTVWVFMRGCGWKAVDTGWEYGTGERDAGFMKTCSVDRAWRMGRDHSSRGASFIQRFESYSCDLFLINDVVITYGCLERRTLPLSGSASPLALLMKKP